MTLPADPLTTADDLWQNLVEHQPGVAAALAMQLRALPEDWSQRLLGLARPHAALKLPSTAEAPMEIEPYDAADWENCPTCGKHNRLCRYHEGFTTGYEALNQPLMEAARGNPTLTVADAMRRLTEAEEAAETDEDGDTVIFHDTGDIDFEDAHAECIQPHLSADGYVDCDGRAL
jgi:hypothetical protein